MKKSVIKLLCLTLSVAVCLPLLLCGCGGDTDYRVKVQDALGNPYSEGVVVVFMKDGAQAGMAVVGEDGVATKSLAKGNYTVQLNFTSSDTEYYYDAKEVKLTGKDTEATVVLAKKGKNGEPLYVGGDEFLPVAATVGCTYGQLKEGRNYFLFTPTVAGLYEFSLPTGNGTLGYYGAPHFVQSLSIEEVKDNKFTVSIKASMIGTGGSGTTTLVIGVDVDQAQDAVLAIERIGEPIYSVEDEPWTIYKKTVELKEYTLPEGATLKEFDLKADTYQLVMDTEGFYHLNTADGPLVLMRLAEKSKYLDSFKDILDRSGVSKYFYDENGDFVKKESYSECLLEYIEMVDEEAGVYPLTEDLKYIVQQRGEYSGWFDPEASLYLFKDANGVALEGLNAENLWLFMCCYIG